MSHFLPPLNKLPMFSTTPFGKSASFGNTLIVPSSSYHASGFSLLRTLKPNSNSSSFVFLNGGALLRIWSKTCALSLYSACAPHYVSVARHCMHSQTGSQALSSTDTTSPRNAHK
jgi:hypothetical protein